jgi:ribosomal protein S18 acetylase RimI-like enzyme
MPSPAIQNYAGAEMRYRAATASDAETILELWNLSGASMLPTDTANSIRKAVEHPGVVFLLAEEEDMLVGSLIGAFDGWRGNMYRLVVLPSHRRKGIATNLVRRVEEVFGQWKVDRVTALVKNDRPWASRFWESVGYPKDEHSIRHVANLNPAA